MALLRYFPLNTGGAGTITVAAAEPGNKHKVLGWVVSAVNNGTFNFQSPGPVLLTGQIRVFNNVTPHYVPTSVIPYCETPAGAALEFVGTGGAHDGIVVFITEP